MIDIMDVRDNKESSNLLQHSENLSLSDLELPEIEHQRKRKVRRKTRPRLSTSRQRTGPAAPGHRYIILIGSVFFVTSCWLLILSYTMSVIHIENQRLQNEIKKVSVICQILPEEMQKWHEKSSLLEKNQSTIYEKINEIQISIEGLKNNFTKFAARADVQSKYTKDDKFVADLGAKLEDVSSDMSVIKQHFTALQNSNAKFEESINKLETRFSEISDHIPENKKDDDICLEKIQNLQTKYENEIKGVAANISTVNDTLTQKADILSVELSTHKSKLDDLFDKSANITSHVTSIENDWTKYRQQLIDSATKIDNFESKIYEVANKTSNFENSLQKVLLYYTSNNTIGTTVNNSTDAVVEHTTRVEDETVNNKAGH